jgi:hypothetical protein
MTPAISISSSKHVMYLLRSFDDKGNGVCKIKKFQSKFIECEFTQIKIGLSKLMNDKRLLKRSFSRSLYF